MKGGKSNRFDFFCCLLSFLVFLSIGRVHTAFMVSPLPQNPSQNPGPKSGQNLSENLNKIWQTSGGEGDFFLPPTAALYIAMYSYI